MILAKGNGEAVSLRWTLGVVLIHVALLVVLFSRAAAQTQPAASAPGDEVWRITIAKDCNEKEGRDHRLMLETLGYIPVYMVGDFTAGKGEVYLGNFPNQKEAQKMKEQLIRDGFTPGEIIKTARNAGAGSGAFTILAGTFDDITTATREKTRLEKAGQLNVRVRTDTITGRVLLMVGKFISPDSAQPVLAALRDNMGLVNAKIVDSIRGEEVLMQSGTGGNYSDKITAKDVEDRTGYKLTQEQMRQIESLIQAKASVNSLKTNGASSGTVSEKVIRLNEKISKLEKSIGGVASTVDEIQNSRQKEINGMKKVADLMRDSNNLAKGGRTEEALAKVREILAMDPSNQVALSRERTFQSMISGEGYEGESARTESQYNQLKQAARQSRETKRKELAVASQPMVVTPPIAVSVPVIPSVPIQPPLPPVPPPADMFFQHPGFNNFVLAAGDSESTFAADVDTASYTIVRNYLERQMLPPVQAVRIEEIINYFPDRYAPPDNNTFAVYCEASPSPFGPGLHLMKIGIKGREALHRTRPPLVLTFVVDVSGSMADGGRLELVKHMLTRLTNYLQPSDKVGIAIYHTNGSELLAHSNISNRQAILDAINSLRPMGSTNAAEGLTIGYGMARRAFDPNGTNRVILCSDGVANTGTTDAESILNQIGQSANDKIYLSAVGVGMGNYNDVLLENLANKGNGAYAYIDDDAEAARFVDTELLSTMEVIAQDVKIQVQFNPGAVRAYRLLGFENRDIPDAEFRNDKRDAGEIGSGHSVTALYEVELNRGVESLDMADVLIRFKQPGRDMQVKEVRGTLGAHEVLRGRFEQTDEHFKLAVIAAEYAEILRESPWAQDGSMGEVARMYDAAFEGGDPCPEAADLRRQIGMAARLLASKPEIPPLSSVRSVPVPRDRAAAIPLTE